MLIWYSKRITIGERFYSETKFQSNNRRKTGNSIEIFSGKKKKEVGQRTYSDVIISEKRTVEQTKVKRIFI